MELVAEWEEKKCLHCKKAISDFYFKNKVYCNTKCKNKYLREIWRKNNPISNLSTGTVGAISELKICADLLSKGFSVFRAVSPSCSCDLALMVKNNLIRIEVTTGFISSSGNLVHSKKKDQHKFDLLAIVTKCEKIIYEPSIEEIYKKYGNPFENDL